MRPASTPSPLRRRAGALLGTIGVVALLAALVAGYAERALFDSEQFAARASAALTDDAVRERVAVAVTDDVVLRANRDLVAVRPLIEGVTEEIVGSGIFRGLFRASVADVHRSVFEENANTVTLTVANLGVVLSAALERLVPEAAGMVPRTIDIVDSHPPGWLIGLVETAEDVRALAWLLLAVALLALGGALALSRDRRESLRRGGIGIAVGALLLLVAYGVLHARLVGSVSDAGLRGALDGVWDAYLLDLRNLLLLTAGCGAVVAAAAASVLRPISLEQPLRAAWRRLATPPEHAVLRALRALALVALGALIVADPSAALRLLAVAAGIGLIYLGVQELLRLVVAPHASAAAGGARERLLPRNVALAGGAAALAIVAAGSLFVASGGASQEDVELAGCNGHRELCDRTLPEITLPATHNSFSAADYPNWMFAQHESGIASQLAGGIRGFLVDTYWGRRAPNGRVVTDLADIHNKSRQEMVAEFGEAAVDAALAVRDSVAGTTAAREGPRDIYMCHGFCEVGARLARTELAAMRDYLVSHPNQVIVVINQNEGVGPEEFAEIVEQSGLGDLVYRGPVDGEWPTLAEMIRSGQRVVMMAENPPFDRVPWYHEAYAIAEETPYRFERPAQLLDPKLLPASCELNRGRAGAQLFLVNHWIDTSPAPRPSNAAKVNAYGPLLRRARECGRLRDHRPNMLAVDFWKTGDVLGVADELNGLR